METVLQAILGVFGLFGKSEAQRRQAELAEKELANRRLETQERFGYLRDALFADERRRQLESIGQAQEAYNRAGIERTRVFYSYAKLRELRGVFIATAGAGLAGLALYLSRKETA